MKQKQKKNCERCDFIVDDMVFENVSQFSYLGTQIDENKIKIIKFGVRQDSVLGPTLFKIFVNDLHKNLSFPTFSYADDTGVFVTGNDLDCMNNLGAIALKQAKVWFHANNLLLYENKTQHTIFSTRSDLTDYTQYCHKFCQYFQCL